MMDNGNSNGNANGFLFSLLWCFQGFLLLAEFLEFAMGIRLIRCTFGRNNSDSNGSNSNSDGSMNCFSPFCDASKDCDVLIANIIDLEAFMGIGIDKMYI